jgi:uncharacterized protein
MLSGRGDHLASPCFDERPDEPSAAIFIRGQIALAAVKIFESSPLHCRMAVAPVLMNNLQADLKSDHPDPRSDARRVVKIHNLRTQSTVASRVEVADRGPVRRRGLLGRRSLAEDEGLWIVPCEAVHTFGMRFAIDLVFLDRRNVVRKVRSSVPPWRLSGCLRAHSVLELAAGTLTRMPVAPGDTLQLSPASFPYSPEKDRASR